PVLRAQIEDNFTDGNFTANPTWQGDVGSFAVNAAGQLQLMAPAGGSALLQTQGNIPDSAVWRVWVKLNFAPSTSNYLKLYLMCDQPVLTLGNGYFLLIGESGNVDALKLYRQDGSTSVLLGSGSVGTVAAEPALARIKVVRKVNGDWSLSADYSGGQTLVPEFTPDLPDTQPPSVVAVTALDSLRLEVDFDEALLSSTALDVARYAVNNGIGQPVESALNGNTYTLTVQGMKDALGNTQTQAQTIDFEYLLLSVPQPGDLVVNEILFNPNTGGSRYIELLNNLLANRNKAVQVQEVHTFTSKMDTEQPKTVDDIVAQEPPSVFTQMESLIAEISQEEMALHDVAHVKTEVTEEPDDDDLDDLQPNLQQKLEVPSPMDMPGLQSVERIMPTAKQTNEALMERFEHAKHLLYEKKDANQAHIELEKLFDTGFPEDVLYNLLGEVAFVKGEFIFARNCWDRVTNINPKFPFIFLKLGNLTKNHFNGFKKTSAEYYKRAIQENPENPTAYFELADVMHQYLDKDKKATKYYERESERCLAEANRLEEAQAPKPTGLPPIPESTPTPEQVSSPKALKITSEVPPIAQQQEQVEHERPVAPPKTLQIVLITGATSGIGLATAKRFAELGCKLILTGRRRELLMAAQAELAKENPGTQIKLLNFDVREPETARAALNSLPEDWQNIDILVNNAGLAKGFDPIHEGKLEHWETMIDTNIKGLLYVTLSPGHVEETEFAITRFDGDSEKAAIYSDFQPLKAEDVADAIFYMATRPPHVNIQDIYMFGVQQAGRTEDGTPQDGECVVVQNHRQEFLAHGHYNNGSIAVRILSYVLSDDLQNPDFWLKRFENAFSMRKTIGLPQEDVTNCFRLVHGEGDYLPGLIVDVYAHVAVVQCHSVDWVTGQKTGFFLDQRDNRQLLGHYAKGKRVLNTFCYTGGFSLYALQGGATLVHSVDVSAKAMALTETNVQLAGEVAAARHQGFTEDVMPFLKNDTTLYDIVIVDPPAFAKTLDKRHNAVQGYKRLNVAALQRVIDRALFYNTIVAAALEAGRKARVIHHLSQSPDHPTGFAYGDKAYIIVERTGGQLDQPHQLRSGQTISFFCNQPHVVQPEKQGIINFVQRNRMKIILYAHDVPDWINMGALGIDMVFDERSYKEMESALAKVIAAKGNRLAELRDIFSGKIAPQQVLIPHQIDLPNLNASQNAAISHILHTNDVSLVHGPPGTGKTTTIVAAIQLLTRTESTVLVCAPSNTAADLLTERLAEKNLKVVRIGNISRMDDNIIPYTLDSLLSNHPDSRHIKKVKMQAAEARRQAGRFKRTFDRDDRLERQQLKAEAYELLAWVTQLEDKLVNDLLTDADAIISTLVGAAHPVLDKFRFRTVVIDEAAQALEPATWIPILKASRVVLAGDPLQLPPTVKSHEAARKGLSKTLLERAIAHFPYVSLLNVQYRMHSAIMGFSNDYFYRGELTADSQVAEKRLVCLEKLTDIVHIFEPVVFIDTAGCDFEEKQVIPTNANKNDPFKATSRYNPEEALLVREHILKVLNRFEPENLPSFGVLSPYREQINHLEEILRGDAEIAPFFDKFATESLYKVLTVSTIDGFQGQERDVMYISLVRSNNKNEIGFLSDYRRMNVAMTRARQLLVIIGDSATIGNNPFYSAMLDYCAAHGQYQTAWEYLQ
ncbi:unnamed protein product, partial [Darwinula stevensoni]